MILIDMQNIDMGNSICGIKYVGNSICGIKYVGNSTWNKSHVSSRASDKVDCKLGKQEFLEDKLDFLTIYVRVTA